MSIKLMRVSYRGDKWWLLFWTVLFFPIAIMLFVLQAVWIEQEITPQELEELDKS